MSPWVSPPGAGCEPDAEGSTESDVIPGRPPLWAASGGRVCPNSRWARVNLLPARLISEGSVVMDRLCASFGLPVLRRFF